MDMKKTALFIAVTALVLTSLSATDWKAYRKAHNLAKRKTL